MGQETELIKCECGAEAERPIFDDSFTGLWSIDCTKCYKGVEDETLEGAIRLWNKAMQPEDPIKAELIEALEEMITAVQVLGIQDKAWDEIEVAQEALEKAKGDR